MTGGGLEIRAWDSINAYRPANARIVSFSFYISDVKFVCTYGASQETSTPLLYSNNKYSTRTSSTLYW